MVGEEKSFRFCKKSWDMYADEKAPGETERTIRRNRGVNHREIRPFRNSIHVFEWQRGK